MVVATHDHVQTVDDRVEPAEVCKVKGVLGDRACGSTGGGGGVNIGVDHHIEAEQLAHDTVFSGGVHTLKDRRALVVLQAANCREHDRVDHPLGIRRPVGLRQRINHVHEVLESHVVRACKTVRGQLVIRCQGVQAGGRGSARRTECSRRGRAARVGGICTTVLIQTTQTISAASGHRSARAGLIVVDDHGQGFGLREFGQTVINNIRFQTVDVVKCGSTDRELDVDVLQHQLPNRGVFSRCCAVVLNGVAPLCARIARFYPELIRRTLGSHGTRQAAHRVIHTQRHEHGIVCGTTALAIAACGQQRGFVHVCVVLRLVGEHLEFLFETLAAVGVVTQLLTHAAIHILTHRLGDGTNQAGSVQACNLGFQSGDLLGQFSLGSFDRLVSLGCNFFSFGKGRRFDCVQFFDDFLRHD